MLLKRFYQRNLENQGTQKYAMSLTVWRSLLKHPVTLKASTWSDYKHHNTAKVLVSVTPNGAFNFVSEAWGGQTSDVHWTRESNFYDILEPHDEVMADRRFTVMEDLLIRNATLHIPAGKRGNEQLPKSDVKKTKEVANLRIFVKQAIHRLKTFCLIEYELPISLLDNNY